MTFDELTEAEQRTVVDLYLKLKEESVDRGDPDRFKDLKVLGKLLG